MSIRRVGRWIGYGIAVLAVLVLVGAVVYFYFPGYTYQMVQQLELYRAGLETRSFEVDGFTMPYVIGGEGPPLVLLHGFGADKSNWTRVAPYLTPHFQVVAPDLPGFGESTRKPDADYTYSAQIRRMKTFLDTLNLESVHLGGNSMGGEIAARFALRYPERVRSLWLLAPGGVESAAPSKLDRLIEQGHENPLYVDSPEDFDRLMDFAFEKEPYVPGPIKDYLARRAMQNRQFNAMVSQQLQADTRALEDELKGLSVPTLVMWGKQDRLLHVSGAGILASAMPDAQSVILGETGHVPMMERPQQSARAFLEFHGIETAAAK